jgi:hypothetical protein
VRLRGAPQGTIANRLAAVMRLDQGGPRSRAPKFFWLKSVPPAITPNPATCFSASHSGLAIIRGQDGGRHTRPLCVR